MPHGYDITRSEADGRTRLEIGGFPYGEWTAILDGVSGKGPALPSPAPESIRLAYGEGPGVEGAGWTVHAGAQPPASPSTTPDAGPPRLLLESADGGRSFVIESDEVEPIRALLVAVIEHALRAGRDRLPPLEIPEGVADRAWQDAAGGLHLNPNRKVLRGDELVLSGNLGFTFHMGRGEPESATVPVVRLVAGPDGRIRWEGPEEVPARTYVREHLDSWPGCFAPLLIVVLAVVFVLAAVILGRACLADAAVR